MKRVIGVLLFALFAFAFAQGGPGIPHLVLGTAQNSDGTPIADGCGRFMAYHYHAAAETLTQDSEFCSFTGDDWLIQTGALDMAAGDTLALRIWNVCTGESAFVLIVLNSAPAQDFGAVLLNAAATEIITVLAPNGGESFLYGASTNIQWTASASITSVNLYYSTNGGGLWTSIATAVPATPATRAWTVPSVSSTNCLVKVEKNGAPAIFDVSNAVFSIHPPATGTLELNYPVGGEVFTFGNNIAIRWTGSAITGVDIFYSADGGTTWAPLAASQPASGTYNWTAPSVASTQYRVRVWAAEDHALVRTSANFTINAPADITPPSRVIDLAVDSVQTTRVKLSWTVTGDDGNVGLATSTHIRRNNATVTEANWGTSVNITGVPTPAAPGTRQSMWVEGLTPTSTYYFGLKVADEVPNYSTLSNIVAATLPASPDTTAPADFTVRAESLRCVAARIAWNATGDDGNVGTANRYEFRYATFALTAANFATGTLCTGVPIPAVAGTAQNFQLTSLLPSTHYWVAAYAFDEAGNRSALGIVDFTTPICSDSIPPAAITTIGCSDFGPDRIRITWTASGDDGMTGNADRYVLHYSTAPFDEAHLTGTTAVPLGMIPGAPGSTELAWIAGLARATQYFFVIFAYDEAGNRSPFGAVGLCATMGIQAHLPDFEMEEDGPDFRIGDFREVFTPDDMVFWATAGDGITISYRLTGNEVWADLASDFHGTTQVIFWAQHGAFLISDTALINVTTGNDPPDFTNAPTDTIVIPGISWQFDFDATDADGDPLRFFIASGADSMRIDPTTGVFTWNAPAYLGEGHYNITVAVTDGEDTTQLTFPLNITKITNPVFAPINLVAYSGFAGCIPLIWDVPTAILTDYPVEISGYEIFRSTSHDVGFTSIGTTDLNTFCDVDIICGRTYYYYVRANYTIPAGQSANSNVASGMCNDSAGRIYSAWTTLPPSVDGYGLEGCWSHTATVNLGSGAVMKLVNTAGMLYGLINFDEVLPEGFEFSLFFDDDNSDSWDAAPSDEGRIYFRKSATGTVGYFQRITNISGVTTLGSASPYTLGSSQWRETPSTTTLEFSISLGDAQRFGIFAGDSTNFAICGATVADTAFKWTASTDFLTPSSYGTLLLGSLGGSLDIHSYPNSLILTLATGTSGMLPLNIVNFGDVVGYYRVESQPDWVLSAPSEGFLIPSEPKQIVVTIDAHRPVGNYVGTIQLYTTDPHTPYRNVEVILHVVAADPEDYLVINVPAVTYSDAGDTVSIPVSAGELYSNSITRVRFTLQTNAVIATPLSVLRGSTLPTDWTVTVSSMTTNSVVVDLAGTTPLTTSGEIARVNYAINATSREGFASALNFSATTINSGTPNAIVENGIIVVGTQILSYWAATLMLIDPSSGAMLDSARFGLHSLASDNFDRVIDHLDPPAFPAVGNIYFVSADRYELTRDLRRLGDRALVFPLYIHDDGLLKWDARKIFPGCYIGDTLSMNAESTLAVSAGDTVKIHFRYNDMNVAQIELFRGWNLISMPFTDSVSVATALPHVVGGEAWFFDQVYRTYNVATRFRGGQGYWVFNTRHDKYTVSGAPLFEYELHLMPGWYVIGAPIAGCSWAIQTATPEDAIVWTICTGYDSEFYRAYTADVLEPGVGYWIYVLEPCVLKISSIYIDMH